MPTPPPIAVQPLDPALLAQLVRLLHKLKHDLSNSLVAAMGELDLLAEDVDDVALAERLHETRGNLLRPFRDLRRITTGLPLPEGAPVRWQDVRHELETRARELGVALEWQPDVVRWLAADPALRPIVAALVTNALDAATAGVTVDVSLTAEPQTGDHFLQIRDDGPGCSDLLAAADGKLARTGGAHLGLGLPVAAAILAQRGGHLTLQENAPHGLLAIASWPED